MSKIRRSYLKEKDAKKLLAEFLKRVKISSHQLLALKPPIELAKASGEEIFFIDKKPIFAKSNANLFPTLASGNLLLNMPEVTVDMGAVPHVCNGADVMAPGIVRFKGVFSKEDFVVVSDERHQKPIAIAKALYDVVEAKKLKRGKILKNIHYVGDKLWNTMKRIGQAE